MIDLQVHDQPLIICMRLMSTARISLTREEANRQYSAYISPVNCMCNTRVLCCYNVTTPTLHLSINQFLAHRYNLGNLDPPHRERSSARKHKLA